MKCPRCQQENHVGALFCGQCGAQLEVLCFGCHAPNPPANRFCHRCGQPLATAAGSVSASTAVVTHDDSSVARSGEGAKRRGSTVRRRLEEGAVPDQDREPDDVESPRSRAKPEHLCIVSRDRLVTGELLEALQMSLDPDDELEIIPDRRRADWSVEAKPGAADQPSIDRRCHLYVDLALQKKGFSIVPAPVANPLRIAERLAPDVLRSPIERLPLGDSDADNRELERILQLKRRRGRRPCDRARGGKLLARATRAPRRNQRPTRSPPCRPRRGAILFRRGLQACRGWNWSTTLRRLRRDGARLTPRGSRTRLGSPSPAPRFPSSSAWRTALCSTSRWTPVPSRGPTAERGRPAVQPLSISGSACLRATSESRSPWGGSAFVARFTKTYMSALRSPTTLGILGGT